MKVRKSKKGGALMKKFHKLNKILVLTLACAITTGIIVPGTQVKGAEPQTLFEEKFDAAALDTKWTLDKGPINIENREAYIHTAPNSIKLDKNDTISTSISTAGYENINVSFWYITGSYTSGKLSVEYSVDNGTTYKEIFGVDAKQQTFVSKEVQLDKDANDTNLLLRLKQYGNTGGAYTDTAPSAVNVWVDDIKVTGVAKGGAPAATATPAATAAPAATTSPAATATPAATTAPVKVSFVDVPNGMWAKSFIEDITANGVAIPLTNNEFLPESNITRAEFSALLVQALKLNTADGTNTFTDVKAGEWYEKYVIAAVKAGLIQGNGDGTFMPNGTLSRQDMAVIMSRAMKIAKGIETETDGKAYLTFTDNGAIESYAQKAIATAVKYGVIIGKPGKVFDPANSVTRAEAAKVISKILGKLEPVAASTTPAAGSEYANDDIPQAANIGSDKVLYKDVPIGKGGDVTLKIDIVTPKEKPEKPLPVLVYIYGGGWNHGTKNDHTNKIAGYVDKGYIGVALEYRLTDKTTFPGQLEDCKLAIRYLRANGDKYFMDTDRIGVWGSSSGSHLAALLGTTGDVKELEGNGGWEGYSSRVQAVVDWYGAADFTTEFANNWSSVSKLLGKNAFAVPDKAIAAMPGTYASKDDPPFLVMHGDKDQTIPYYDSVVFAQALKRAGVDLTFKIVKGAPHGFADFPDAAVMAWDFLDKKLKNK